MKSHVSLSELTLVDIKKNKSISLSLKVFLLELHNTMALYNNAYYFIILNITMLPLIPAI